MPMTSSNIPHLKGTAMADTRSDAHKAETKPAAGSDKTEKTAEKPAQAKYARAGESGDPTVQKLLAERETHLMNAQPDPSFAAQREAAEAAVKDIDKQLNELGFTAE